jgi:hypothetical protein
LTSENNAASSETAASNSAAAALASENAAATLYDSFDDRYLGAKGSAPTLDNDGNALILGALYFNTVDAGMKVWDGSAWLDAYAAISVPNLESVTTEGNTTTNAISTGAVTAPSITLGTWTISDVGGKLVFNNGAARFSISAAGAVIADGDVTAEGTP